MAKAIAKKTVTREAYETALKSYVHNDNKACKLAAERDRELEPINNKYNGQLEELLLENAEAFAIVHQYSEENRAEMFEEAKTIEVFGAEIGFREGKDKVMILEGYDEKAIALVMAKRKTWAPFVRSMPAMDKALLIKMKPKGMEKLGFRIGKDETFFLKPVKTEV